MAEYGMAGAGMTPLEVSTRYWDAECRRDIDAVMEHYHDDATYEDASGQYRGHAQIRGFYEASAKAWPGLRLRIVSDVSVGARSAVEFEAELTGAADATVRVRGVNLVEVRDGRFVSVRSYEDSPVPMT